MNIRYIHIRPLVKKGRKFESAQFGGATVRIEQKENDPFHVYMSTAMCSKRDRFVKKDGRVLASGRDAQRVPLRYIGGILSQVADEVQDSTGAATEATDYHYAMRYFLPKE